MCWSILLRRWRPWSTNGGSLCWMRLYTRERWLMNAGNRWAAFAMETMQMAEAAQKLGLWNQVCVEANAELGRFEDACYGLEKYLIPLTYPDAVPSGQVNSLPSEKDASEAL